MENNSELGAFRRKIDDLDDKIIQLMLERIEIVKKVGDHKRKTGSPECPIRPGREAEMVRRIMACFKPTDFPAGAGAAIWRIIIGASTGIESELKLSVFTPERDNDLYWLAREYFGPTAPILKQPQINRVIGDVMDNKASVGIVPFLRSSDTTPWWTNLMQAGDGTPKIFAHVPFVYTDVPGKAIPSALAIAKLVPEPSGDDMSLVVIEADHNVSQHKLQTAFTAEKMEASWINIASLSPSSRHHLLELKGFVTAEHEGLKAVLATLGNSVLRVSFLGAYAAPMTLTGALNTADKKHVAK